MWRLPITLLVSLVSLLAGATLSWAVLAREYRVHDNGRGGDVDSVSEEPARECTPNEEMLEALRKLAAHPTGPSASSDADAGETVAQQGRELGAALAGLRTPVLGPGPNGFKVASAAKKLGYTGLAIVLAELETTDPRRRIAALQLLAQLDDPAAVSTVADIARNDKDETVATVASQSLALMSSPEAVESMQQIAASPRNVASQINALYGLSSQGDANGLQMAISYMENADNSQQSRTLLAANLPLSNSPAAMPAVDAAVAEFQGSNSVVSNAINYYHSIDTPDALARLSQLAQNPAVNPSLRQLAASYAKP